MKDLVSEKGMRVRSVLRKVAKGKRGSRDMSREQAREILEFFFSAEADRAQIGALLTAMRFKSTCHDEYLGFLDAIYDYSHLIQPKVENLVNANGPYDGRKSYFQLSPAAAILASAAGVPMLLHCSDDLPPKKGVTSGKVLESLGIPAYLEPHSVQKSVETHGFGFLHSRVFSYGIETLRSVRETLFYRSFIHSCEVLLNPGQAKLSIIGAAHGTFIERFTDVLAAQGLEHVLTVQGLDGSDELPLKAIPVVEYKNGTSHQYTLSPTDFGLSEKEPTRCKDAAETARITREAFENKNDEIRDSLIYNGGIRIYIGKKASSPEEGINIARETLENGKALAKLDSLSSQSV
jgi:anthranilate phosphoribosyltransferase